MHLSGTSPAALALPLALAFSLTTCAIIRPAHAFAVGLRFNHTECFHKEIAPERAEAAHVSPDEMPFQVVGAYLVSKSRADLNPEHHGSSDWNLPKVEVTVTQPDGTRIFVDDHSKARGDIQCSGRGVGHYSVCFTNVGKRGRWAWNDAWASEDKVDAYVRVLYFQPVHHEDQEKADKLVERHAARHEPARRPVGNKALGNRGKILHKKSTSEVKGLALALGDEISLMRQEVNYLKARALRHKMTADSNSRRTLYWTVVEVSVLVLVAAVNVIAVRHFFHRDQGRKNNARVSGPGVMGGTTGFGGVQGFGSGLSGGTVPPPPGMGGNGGYAGAGFGSSYGIGGSSVYGGSAEGLGSRFRST